MSDSYYGDLVLMKPNISILGEGFNAEASCRVEGQLTPLRFSEHMTAAHLSGYLRRFMGGPDMILVERMRNACMLVKITDPFTGRLRPFWEVIKKRKIQPDLSQMPRVVELG